MLGIDTALRRRILGALARMNAERLAVMRRIIAVSINVRKTAQRILGMQVAMVTTTAGNGRSTATGITAIRTGRLAATGCIRIANANAERMIHVGRIGTERLTGTGGRTLGTG